MTKILGIVMEAKFDCISVVRGLQSFKFDGHKVGYFVPHLLLLHKHYYYFF